MRTKTFVAVAATALPLAAHVQGVRIVQSNDDGWAELYVRSFHDSLIAAGHDVVLSAPAENKSGTGSTDVEPSPRSSACQYNSCAPSSGPVGRNATSPRLNWVNSFPVTSMRYGIDLFGPQAWNGAKPDLAVAGPNVGSNLYLAVHFSGTVGATVHAVKSGIPGVAFSGASEGTLPWDTPAPIPPRSLVYAELATKFTNALVASGKPYLPPNVWLNVNFPKVEEGGGACTRADQFKFVLTRINLGLFSGPDVMHCGSTRLPTETDVILNKNGACYVAVSVGDARDKTTASAEDQKVVLEKLKGLFVCI